VDNEHWSALPSKARSAASDVLLLNGEGARRGTRELSGAWREHFCRACGAVVVRADHHCPFLATCIGAHNQAYFVALLLHMALSMTWGAGLIVPPAIACSSSIAQAASLPPPAPHGGGAAGEVPGAEALRRCRVIAPIGAGIVFLAGSLAFFLFCVHQRVPAARSAALQGRAPCHPAPHCRPRPWPLGSAGCCARTATEMVATAHPLSTNFVCKCGTPGNALARCPRARGCVLGPRSGTGRRKLERVGGTVPNASERFMISGRIEWHVVLQLSDVESTALSRGFGAQ
jgi:hypothetical protein